MQDLIAAMSKANFYPHRPVEVELKQTHISCVFLAGEFVYDVVRKELAHIPHTERVRDEYGAGIYTDDFTRVTYLTLLAKAERCLQSGEGVIIDATFKEPEYRRLFLDRAGEKGIPVLFIECRVREEEVLRRLKQRQEKTGEVSDATPEIYHRHRNTFASLADVPDRFRFQVDTETNLQGVLEELEGSL